MARYLPVLLALLLAGCEQIGIEDPAKMDARRDGEARAIGAACRHSGRALEECYAVNPRALKASVFAGWRDMDGYMRENKIDTMTASPETAKPERPAPKS